MTKQFNIVIDWSDYSFYLIPTICVEKNCGVHFKWIYLTIRVYQDRWREEAKEEDEEEG